MKKTLLIINLVLIPLLCLCQNIGTVLLIPNDDCRVSIDGEPATQYQKQKPLKVELTFGEHYIQANNNEEEISQIIDVNDSKQQIVKLEFTNIIQKTTDATPELSAILISDQDMTLSGGMNSLLLEQAILNESNHQYFNLAKGDLLKLSGRLVNKKGDFTINFYSYPDLTKVYSKSKLREINVEIPIKHEGIYVLEYSSNALFDRTLKIKTERIPISPSSAQKNIKVEKKYRYEVVNLGKTFQYINSISHETWKGGTNEVLVPVNIPHDAEEWYYSFAASRDEAQLKQSMENTSLFGQITESLNGLDPTTTAINAVIKLINSPPGADYCNVYLLDHLNSQLFLRDAPMSYILTGSRKNLKSSTIEVKCCMDTQYYLGIENTNQMHGIHVAVEIVAIKKIGYLASVE